MLRFCLIAISMVLDIVPGAATAAESVAAAERSSGMANYVPAVVVGLFTLVGAVGGTVLANQLQKWREHRRERAELEAFLKAVRTELQETWKRYEKAIGEWIRDHDEDQPFFIPFRTYNDFFTVYRRTASDLGRVPDDELRNAIERAYIYMYALLDTHRLTVDLYDRLDENVDRGRTSADEAYSLARRQTGTLKNIRLESEKHVKEATQRINAFLDEPTPDNEGEQTP